MSLTAKYAILSQTYEHHQLSKKPYVQITQLTYYRITTWCRYRRISEIIVVSDVTCDHRGTEFMSGKLTKYSLEFMFCPMDLQLASGCQWTNRTYTPTTQVSPTVSHTKRNANEVTSNSFTLNTISLQRGSRRSPI